MQFFFITILSILFLGRSTFAHILSSKSAAGGASAHATICNYQMGNGPDLKGGPNLLRETRNDSIYSANYARVPPELLDPNYGIIDYLADRNAAVGNVSKEGRDSQWLTNMEKMRDIDMDAQKYANVFSKAFAAGYSAAVVDKQNQLQETVKEASVTSKQKKNSTNSEIKKDNKTSSKNPAYPDGYAAGYAAGRDKMQTDDKSNRKNATKNVTSYNEEAVRYGAAYASGYALAAADRASSVTARRTAGNKSNTSVEIKPWNMNNAAAAGYAAYYAAAIANTRAVREEARLEREEEENKKRRMVQSEVDQKKKRQEEVNHNNKIQAVAAELLRQQEKLKTLQQEENRTKRKRQQLKEQQEHLLLNLHGKNLIKKVSKDILSGVKKERKRFLEEAERAFVDPENGSLVRVMVLPLKNGTVLKRSRRRKKRRQKDELINCGVL